MSKTTVLFFQEEDESVPMVAWLDSLPRRAQIKCVSRLDRLSELGHKLRRPEADYLWDDIYELRASLQSIHYRMLYFFHGQAAVVVSHGIIKERAVPAKEIELVIERKARFAADPETHSFVPPTRRSGS